LFLSITQIKTKKKNNYIHPPPPPPPPTVLSYRYRGIAEPAF
jgi:hypothetical protein